MIILYSKNFQLSTGLLQLLLILIKKYNIIIIEKRKGDKNGFK